MADRYPGYDVLAKRYSPSWNEQTRQVVDARLSLDPTAHLFFSDEEWPTVRAISARIVPQPTSGPERVPVAALIDRKLHADAGDGYRDARLPPMGEAWRRALRAIDGEAAARHRRRFHDCAAAEQDALLRVVQAGDARDPAWGDMPPAVFFTERLLHDIVTAYYAHPAAWSEIGFGGPAGPRGYVRMNYDRRDPWEAAEAKPGHEDEARRDNARVG